MTDGRRKGQQYMADKCRELSHWWFGTALKARAEEMPLRPKSTIMASLEGWRRKGDVVVSPTHDKDWPFSVEFKKDEGWAGLEGLWEAPKYALYRWWDQCVEQAIASESPHPLLLFSRNRRKDYVLARTATLSWLNLDPRNGPLAHLRLPNGEHLTLALLEDLLLTRSRSSRAAGSRRRSGKRSRP